jgi:hypothetical protein
MWRCVYLALTDVSEERHLRSHRCETVKSYMLYIIAIINKNKDV